MVPSLRSYLSLSTLSTTPSAAVSPPLRGSLRLLVFFFLLSLTLSPLLLAATLYLLRSDPKVVTHPPIGYYDRLGIPRRRRRRS